MLRFILPALVLGLTATGADATAVIYNFSGNVASSGIAGTGSTFSGSFSYDASVASAQCGSINYGGSYCTYDAISSVTFTSGSLATTVVVPAGGNIFQTLNNYKSSVSAAPYDLVSFDTLGYGSTNPVYYRIMVSLYDTTSAALANASAPPSILLNKFNIANFRVETIEGNFGGTITSLTSPTAPSAAALPEPATWAMLMLGFGGLAFAMRRRQNVSTGFRFQTCRRKPADLGAI